MMSYDDLKLLDIHYCILIKRHGSKKALEIMKEILPKEYKHEIELDENSIGGYNRSIDKYCKWKRFNIQLGHCRNKWLISEQRKYLYTRMCDTDDQIYIRIMKYQDKMFGLYDRFHNRFGLKFEEIDESIEDEYMKLIGEV